MSIFESIILVSVVNTYVFLIRDGLQYIVLKTDTVDINTSFADFNIDIETLYQADLKIAIY
jgi:hypothetical protein